VSTALNACTCGAGPSAPQHRDRAIGGWHRFASPLMTRAEKHAREVGLDFDEACHLYTIDGVELPSVTQVLKAEGFVDYAFCTEFARDRGSRVHEAVHFMVEGDLLQSSVDEEVAPYLKSAEAFLSDMEADVVMAEAVVYSALYGYAGKADLFAYLRKRHRLANVDWKTGVPPQATGLQLAGYSGAWLEMTGEAVIDRLAVQLTPGKPKPYKIHEFTDRGDLAVFRGGASSTNWKRRHLVRAA
jgi:hypothetical protein